MGLSDLFKRLLPKVAVATGVITADEAFFDELIEKTRTELAGFNRWWDFKASDSKLFSQDVLSLSDKQKVAFIIYNVKRVYDYYDTTSSMSSEDRSFQITQIRQGFLKNLFKTRIEMDDDDFVEMINTAILYSQKYWGVRVPLKSILNQL